LQSRIQDSKKIVASILDVEPIPESLTLVLPGSPELPFLAAWLQCCFFRGLSAACNMRVATFGITGVDRRDVY
jgi:hypothetical protein